jgi:hypothetical protein
MTLAAPKSASVTKGMKETKAIRAIFYTIGRAIHSLCAADSPSSLLKKPDRSL